MPALTFRITFSQSSACLRNVREIRVLERQLARPRAVVVTGGAVRLDQCGVGRGPSRSTRRAAVPAVPCAKPAGPTNTTARTKASAAERTMVRTQAPGLYYRTCRADLHHASVMIDTRRRSTSMPNSQLPRSIWELEVGSWRAYKAEFLLERIAQRRPDAAIAAVGAPLVQKVRRVDAPVRDAEVARVQRVE